MRLKTGFFETKLYDLQISNGKLRLSPKILGDKEIVLLEKDISNILLKNGESLDLEINTLDQAYQGTITNKANNEDLLGNLRTNLSKKILCEYGGGN